MVQHKNIYKVVHVAFSFFLLFTAFSTCSNVVGEEYDQKDLGSLGFYTLAVIYVTCAFGSLFSSPIMSRIGHIRSMQIGAFCYMVWLGCGLFPITLEKSDTTKLILWIIMIAAGVVNGFGASILWVGQGLYVTECSTSKNKGLFFGLFWCLLMFSQIFGNMMAAFVVDLFSPTVMFIMMSAIAFLGCCSFLFVKKPEKIVEESESEDSLLEKPQGEIKNIRVGENQTNDERSSLASTDETNGPKIANIRSTFKLLLTSKMMRVNMLIIMGGIILAFFSGLLVKLISNTVENKDKKLTKALYCMIVFGFGEVSGSMVIGRIIDKFGNRFSVFVAMFTILLSVGVTIYTHSRDHYDVFWFIAAFLWGTSDSQTNTVCYAICGSEFERTTEAFAVFKFFHSIAAVPFLIAEGYFKNPGQRTDQRWYLIGVGIYCVIACSLCASIKFKKTKKDKYSEAQNESIA